MGLTNGRRKDDRVSAPRSLTAVDIMQQRAEKAEAELTAFREMYCGELMSFAVLFGCERKDLEQLPPEELRARVFDLLQTSAVRLKEEASTAQKAAAENGESSKGGTRSSARRGRRN